VAAWTPDAAAFNRGTERSVTLYVVDPAGRRYLVGSLPMPAGGSASIDDWSGDARRTLVSISPKMVYDELGGLLAGQSVTVDDVDLATGRVLHHFRLAAGGSVEYAKPKGLAVVIQRAGSRYSGALPSVGYGSFRRASLSGVTELEFPATYSGYPMYTPNGTELVVSYGGGLALVSNDGRSVRSLPLDRDPGLARSLGWTKNHPPSCSAVHWWQPGVALASCAGGLVLVPVSGAKPTVLAKNGNTTTGTGFYDAWHVASGTFVEGADDAECAGLNFFEGIGAAGKYQWGNARADNYRADGYIVGADGNRLAVVSSGEPCDGNTSQAPASLVWWDPANGRTSVVLGQPLTDKIASERVQGGSVLSAVVYGGVPWGVAGPASDGWAVG
jgi:hypothetical protein